MKGFLNYISGGKGITMKAVFLQQYASPCFGVLALMSYLKHYGVDCDVVVWALEKRPVETLYKLRPDLIGISLMSTEHYWMVNAVKDIKEKLPETRVIIGGVHAIIYPEAVASVPGVDFVCNSDGERVLLELCHTLNGGKADWSSIRGLVYRNGDGSLHSNGRADFFTYSPEIVEDRTPYFIRYPLMSKILSRVLLQAGDVRTTAVFVTMSRSKISLRMSMVNTFATKILRT